MGKEVKVGDTFKVFEVVLTKFKGSQGVQIGQDDSVVKLTVSTLKYGWFTNKEIKRVGTIRIKSLK